MMNFGERKLASSYGVLYVEVIGNVIPTAEFVWPLGIITGIWDSRTACRLLLVMNFLYGHN